MGKKCHICKKKCSGDVVRADGDRFFHIECFVCKSCGQSLSDIGFYTTPDGAYVCPEHFIRSQRESISSPLSINADQPKVHRQSDLPEPPLGSPNTCAACGDHLQSGQVLLALGKSWHVWCFKCAECSAVLQGEYMAHDGEPLCLRDYNHKYGVKCYECDRYIAGRVLEAGGYKFHPTCAKCSRCGNPFEDGQEMYMQGNEIWHPQCENIATGKMEPRGVGPKYQNQFGQHLTYMYMLPETEQTYLKHPISPHPPQPAQFHTPHGPVIKIRKSRYSMLKTGMQRLTEDLDKSRPRSKSPHMDNEEPIEMAHYPGGHVPDPDTVPPIEREDFPAPPYPYAIEEIRRKLSSSSVENDDDDEDMREEREMKRATKTRVKKNVEILDHIKDSSIAHVLKQNLVEENERRRRQPLHPDPRNSSRTPSAKKMPHLRFRYDTPINASPSRHLNRPKPWVFWQDGSSPASRAATTTIPSFHLPQSRGGTRAATMPDGYGGYYYGDANGTLSSHFSDQSLNVSTLPGGGGVGSPMVGGDMRTNLRTSLPDMSKPVKTYPLEQLQTDPKNPNEKLPEGVDRMHLERHLNREEFEKHFGMAPIEFYKLPEWKRINLKRKMKLF